MFDFIADLDEYFCEKYAGYDKLSVLPGYKMPLMQGSEIREDGRTYAYTLPANTMRLAKQEKKTEILAELKLRMVDLTFSFSFKPVGFFRRVKANFSKYAFYKNLDKMLKIYDFSDQDALQLLDIDKEVWDKIRNGKFLPTKNLLFSLALAAHISLNDTKNLMTLCDYTFDDEIVKDVVMQYLLQEKVYNTDMVKAALTEYKVSNLFLR